MQFKFNNHISVNEMNDQKNDIWFGISLLYNRTVLIRIKLTSVEIIQN